MPDAQKDRNSSGKKPPNSILRYSGMATQMMAIIVLGALAGMWLDGHFNTSTPYFTGGLTILAVIVSMYVAVKDLLRDGGQDKRQDQRKP